MEPALSSLCAFGAITLGVTCLRIAYRLTRADTRDHRRAYPTARHALLGRRSTDGRSGWLAFDRRRGRLVSDVSALR